jgi:hypothetical protein
MKLPISIIVTVLCLTSCDKELSKKEASTSGELVGTWELRSIVGVQRRGAPTQFAPGNKSIVSFTESRVAYYEADTLVSEDAYTLVMDTCWEVEDGPKMLPRFVSENVPDGTGVFLEVIGDKLTIYRHIIAADGSHLKYERID